MREIFDFPYASTQSIANEAIQSYYAARQGVISEHPLISVGKAVIEARIDIAALTQQANSISHRLTRIERGGLPFTATVNDLYPSRYEVKKPIYVCIESDGEEFVATFHDADVSASGETHAEALCNLKDYIVALFEDLALDADSLGPGPNRQYEVLKRFIELP
jgi:predicted RNase H-like HicB family nuclease